LEAIIAADPADIIVIDEIQRIPELLNEIHRLIESQNFTFLIPASPTCWPVLKRWIATPIFMAKVLNNLSVWNYGHT
jgi:hypothetical protein